MPLFFVLLGAQLDLRELTGGDDVLLACLLSAAAAAVHCLDGPRAAPARRGGALASAQIGVPAAAIALGLRARALSQGQASAIFCAALVSIGACSAGARSGPRAGSRDRRSSVRWVNLEDIPSERAVLIPLVRRTPTISRGCSRSSSSASG